jgi:hypothetical protein
MPRCDHCSTSFSTDQALRAHIALTPYCRQQDEATYVDSDSELEFWRDPPASNPYHSDDDEINHFQPTNANNDSTTTTHGTKHTNIEEVEDDKSNDPKSIYTYASDDLYSEVFPGPAGSPVNTEPVLTKFEEICKKQKAEGKEPWYPFETEREWELASWLIRSGLSKKKIDEYCELETVRCQSSVLQYIKLISNRQKVMYHLHSTTAAPFSNL